MANQVRGCHGNCLKVPGSNLVEVYSPIVRYYTLVRYCRYKMKPSFRVYHESYNVLAMCEIVIYIYREVWTHTYQ
jgi:hypothetical protein